MRRRIGRLLNALLALFYLQLGRRTSITRDERLAAMVRPLLARLDVPEETLSGPSSAPLRLPDGATDYLRPDHPRLAELRERYRRFNAPVTQHSWWSDDFVGREVDLRAFRGDGAYVWQLRDFNTGVHYIATAYYTKEIDRLGLLRSLEEDDLFGARTHRFGNR